MFKIDGVVFYTANLELSASFYHELLDIDWAGDDRFSECRIGGIMFALKYPADSREIPGHQTMIVTTPNVMDMYRHCERLRVSFATEISTEAWGMTFSILDPDGNKMEFVESLSCETSDRLNGKG